MNDRVEDLRGWARSLGFDLFGVAPAKPAVTGSFFQKWLEAGHHGEMDYLARRARERLDPGEVLPGARSIICVGMIYSPRLPEVPGPGPKGRVARYAWGEDYHRVLGRKLNELASYLMEENGGRARSYVDTGPVLEREYAREAGLGWFGKNTNLIREGIGSWFLLGEIITDLDLERDDPVADRCGTCTRCIDACPTGAILEPYLLDSNACLAYLTIEHRGSIPRQHRASAGDLVFGCDICQEVCPWNREAPEATEEAFRPREETPGPDLVGLLEMGEAEWKRRTGRTAIRRAGWRGMRRNAAVALGNARDPSGVGPLVRTLGAADPLVRAHVAWALGRIGTPPCAAALRSALDGEEDPRVREEIETALGVGVVR